MDSVAKILARWTGVDLNSVGATVTVTGIADPEGAREAILGARRDIAELVLEIDRLRRELDRARNA